MLWCCREVREAVWNQYMYICHMHIMYMYYRAVHVYYVYYARG